MEDYEFTQDWFTDNEAKWREIMPLIPERRKFLEIGSFEGRSAVWLMEHAMPMDSSLFCIDTWQGGEEHTDDVVEGSEGRFLRNVKIAQTRMPGRQVTPLKGTSYHRLAELIASKHENSFDFAYIDGSHTAWDSLTDACMTFGLLKPGGVLIFDDYLWGHPTFAMHRPKIAIDSFINIFAERLQIIHIGYQMVVRKT